MIIKRLDTLHNVWNNVEIEYECTFDECYFETQMAPMIMLQSISYYICLYFCVKLYNYFTKYKKNIN